MTTIDLTKLSDADGFVIYFGGRPNEVDAYTFANALVAISDAFREINIQVNSGFALEMRLEALAEGSFKARIRGAPKSLKSIFSTLTTSVILPIFVSFLYDEIRGGEKIIVNSGEVIIERGDDRIIIPRASYDTARSLPNKPAVRQNVARAMAVVSADENVESFGIYKELDPDLPPIISIPREAFDRVREIEEVDDLSRRFKDERTILHVLKVVFEASRRKWEFVWNGIKISATIEDAAFLADLLNRQYLIGNGDTLDVTLKISQRWDGTASVWLNDGYAVTKVWSHVPAAPPTQLRLLDDKKP